MSKFLIFGAAGMLAHALKNHDYFCDHVALSFDQCDITEPESIEKYISEHKPKCLLNCAAFTDVAMAQDNISAAMQVNAHGAINLALLANKYMCQLVHFSTDYVFKGDQDVLYTEEMKATPINNYGLTKLKGEEFVQTVKPDALIIRISWLYGENGNNFFSTIARRIINSPELGVVCDQFGKTTYARDAADATMRLLEKQAVGLFHFANEGICSRYDFAQKVYDIYRKIRHLQCIITPIKAGDFSDHTPRPTWSALSTQKYTLATGAKIRSYEEALVEYLENIYRLEYKK